MGEMGLNPRPLGGIKVCKPIFGIKENLDFDAHFSIWMDKLVGQLQDWGLCKALLPSNWNWRGIPLEPKYGL